MTATTQNVRTFTLDALQAAGLTLQEVEAGRAYRAHVDTAELRKVLQRATLHFTFDEEYFDLHREEDVEFVAPGYPLLDALIRLTQARFTVSEAAVPHHAHAARHLAGQQVSLQLQSRGQYRPYLRFRIRVTFTSDSYEEDIITVTVDPRTLQVLPPSAAEWPLMALPAGADHLITRLSDQGIQAAWGVVDKEIQTIVAEKVARHEDTANTRLHLAKSKLEAFLREQHTLTTPQGQRRIDDLIAQHGLSVKHDLIFAELLHYPVEVVSGRAEHVHPRTQTSWSQAVSYEIDRVTGRIDLRPVCPVCQSDMHTVAPCDAGAHLVCPVCTSSCSTCGAQHCDHHPLDTCAVQGCGDGHCAECLSRCARCGDGMCAGTCSVACPDCGDVACRDCVSGCGVCGHEACATHFETCHLTGVALCAAHAVVCAVCAKSTHPASTHVVARADRSATICLQCTRPCAITGKPHHPEDLVQCHETRRMISAPLATMCPACHHPVGQDVLVKTQEGEQICPSCAASCGVCKERHRRSSLVACAGTHQGPPILVCGHHLKSCRSCPPGSQYCVSHSVLCAVCNDPACTTHIQRSALSGRQVCGTHSTFCPDCRRVVASDETVTVRGLPGQAPRTVCRSCSDVCVDCPPNADRHANLALQTCSCGGQQTKHKVCATHVRTCHTCTKTCATTHSSTCTECRHTVCPTHTRTLADGRTVCTDCSASCAHCPPGTIHLLRELKVCRVCNRTTCLDHVQVCADCGGPACPDHAVHLLDNTVLCSAHVVTCGRCGVDTAHSRGQHCSSGPQHEVLCPSCQKTCPSCEQVHCTTHTKVCRCCGLAYCSSCVGNLCETCGHMSKAPLYLNRVKTQWSSLRAAHPTLPMESETVTQMGVRHQRLHLRYTVPPRGFMQTVSQMFSKPVERVAVFELIDATYHLVSDKEVALP